MAERHYFEVGGMLRRFRSPVSLVVVVCSVALGMASVQGTFGEDNQAPIDPARLPALPSAQEQPLVVPARPLGRSAYVPPVRTTPTTPTPTTAPVSTTTTTVTSSSTVPPSAQTGASAQSKKVSAARPSGQSSSLLTSGLVAAIDKVKKLITPGRRVLSGDPPPITYPTAPANGGTVTTLTPTLTVNTVNDPECDAVSYRFKVTTKPDAETGTVIADATLTSITSYTIPYGQLKDGGVYYWHVYTSDPTNTTGTAPGWVSQFKVDLGLGARSIFPNDTEGPAVVNLTDGNLLLSAATPTVESVGGSLGVNFSYNSQTPHQSGLLGVYTIDANGNHVADSTETRALVRRDPEMAFNWGTGSSVPGATATDMVVRWTGYVAAPDTGTYKFGASTSEGIKITVNSTVVVNAWSDQTAGAPVYSGTSSLTAYTPVPIQVEWYRKATSSAVMKLYVKGTGSTTMAESLVPGSWLTADEGALPRGWQMTATGAGGSYVRAEISEGSAILYDAEGSPHTYTANGTSYTPPKDEDGVLASDSSGRLTLSAPDGTNYVFDSAGRLLSATSSSSKPSAAVSTWTTPASSPLPRLTRITDPVSERYITLRYGGDEDCPDSPPSGFDADAPPGMLCQVLLWDATSTKLWYVDGRLARIENPGSSILDFGYDATRINKIREPLAADMIAASLRANDDTTRTLIAYDGTGRVSSITLPEPTATAARPKRTYTYTSGTETRVDVDGLTEPNGFFRKVTYDGLGRKLTDTDATNLATTFTWDDLNHITSTTEPTGLKTTTIYDHAGRATDIYGPAPSSWYGTDLKPTSTYTSQVPHSTASYDSTWQGLDAIFFNNPNFQGAPVAHKLGPEATGLIYGDWSSVAPDPAVTASAWSARLAGEILFDATGNYTITPRAGSKTRVYVDDALIVDSISAASGTYNNVTASTRHRVRVEYVSSYSLPGTTTLNYTGSTVNWSVPNYITSLTAVASGASAGSGGSSSGGLGGSAGATLSVTGGETLAIQVGGQGGNASGTSGGGGGWPNAANGGNGGAGGGSTSAGGTSSWTGGGGGGGATSISRSSTKLLVAAGGGGGGGSNQAVCIGGAGGAGGASTGGSGAGGANGTGGGACQSYGPGAGGGGASVSSGGGAGAGGGGCAQAGGAGASYAGGAGGAYGCYSYGLTGGGGGGGGGYYGGGGGGSPSNNWCAGTGGGAGGGGGGSNYVTGTSTSSNQGTRTGHGQLVLSWTQTFNQPLDLHWTPPSGSDAQIPAAKIFPRYGLATSSTDPDGRVTSNSYDHPELGLLSMTSVDPSGLNLRTTFTYEASGFLRSLGSALPKATVSGVASAKSSVTYYGGTETRTNPCVSGSTALVQGGLVKTKTSPDPDGAGSQAPIVREYVYDAAGRVVAMQVQGDANWTCTTYDARGRTTQVKDRNGGAQDTSYATPGVTTQTFPDSANASRTTVSTTDILGRVVSYADELGTTTRNVFDQAGRVLQGWRQFSGGPDLKIVSTTYDSASRILTAVDYLYTAPSASSPTPRTTTTAYDAYGRVSTVTRPNGVVTTTTYSTLGRASHLETNSSSTAPNEDRTFTLAGKIASDTVNGTAFTYTYDSAERLTTVATSTGTRRYSYDGNTNRCGLGTSCDSAWTYDAADRLTASPYASSYDYDGHGNVTSSTGTAGSPSATIAYDVRDHATTIDDGTQTITETLAPSGRVLRRQIVNDSAPTTIVEDIVFGYSGDGDAPAYARPTAGGAVTTFLVSLGGLVDVDGSGTWNLYDLRGSTLGTTDGSGTYTASAAVDEFGISSGPAPNRYGWLGQQQRFAVGGGLGLVRMGVRLYAPSLGRFLQVDPVEGGSANDYDYLSGDPINDLDIGGTFGWSSVVRAAKAVHHFAEKHAEAINKVMKVAQVGVFLGCIVVLAGACGAAGAILAVANFGARSAIEGRLTARSVGALAVDVAVSYVGYRYSSVWEGVAGRAGARYGSNLFGATVQRGIGWSANAWGGWLGWQVGGEAYGYLGY